MRAGHSRLLPRYTQQLQQIKQWSITYYHQNPQQAQHACDVELKVKVANTAREVRTPMDLHESLCEIIIAEKMEENPRLTKKAAVEMVNRELKEQAAENDDIFRCSGY